MEIKKIRKKNIKKCFFCGDNHICKDCPLEVAVAPILKKFIGNIMENFIGDNYNCPHCNGKLEVLGNHTPSLDIVCKDCNYNYEVKSKCLSIKKIPNDLQLPHGNYNEYKERQNKGLDIFIIIYGVNRLEKKINIREIYHIKNKEIINNNNITVYKRENSNLSFIQINNNKLLNKMEIKSPNIFYFNNIIDHYLLNSNIHEKKIE